MKWRQDFNDRMPLMYHRMRVLGPNHPNTLTARSCLPGDARHTDRAAVLRRILDGRDHRRTSLPRRRGRSSSAQTSIASRSGL